MTTETVLTDEQIAEICRSMPPYPTDAQFARAIEQAVLQSPEIQRLQGIEEAAQGVLDWTEAKHRPPVREAIPVGEYAGVRVHALADLHDALHPDSPAKREPLEQKP